MHWIEAKVTFTAAHEILIDELIADLFYSLGTRGVVVDDPHRQPDADWGPEALPPPDQPAITGYLWVDEHVEERRLALEKGLSALAARHAFQYTVHYQPIDAQDWVEVWKQFFWPQKITPHMVVKPTWREYTAEPGQQVIEIDPGMAFGTGTHPTTVLCLTLLEKHLRPGHAVLDVGTGSGILLIAAAKLGAGRLTGVDLDPIAVSVARKNLLQNNIAGNAFELFSGHLLTPVTQTYHIVVANILADVIVDLLDNVGRVLMPGGIVICSGIIAAHQADVTHKMTACGFAITDELSHGDWIAMAGQLP